MTSHLRFLFLGTGTSTGVPQIGCTCAVCSSPNPRNKRLRSSVVLEYGSTRLLIDSSPDLRQQALREHLNHIDAVIYTHSHLDHVAGFDDMRAFGWNSEKRLPLYASPETLKVLRRMYPWAFSSENTYKGYIRPEGHEIDGPFTIGGICITPFPVEHAAVETNGYVFQCGNVRIGYSSDVKTIPPSSMELLRDLDILVLDCLRKEEHPTHMSVDETLSVMKQVHPRHGYLTHMSHRLDYDELASSLPDDITPAYDGLELFPGLDLG